MQPEVATGTLVGDFRVVSQIGEGAMGRVYLAEDVQRQRRVALKLLVPELAQDERFRQRFLRESRLAARLDHAHVVSTHAFGEEGGLLYLAMDYVEGTDLRELLRLEGKLEPERALGLLGQVADGLDAAHALGLVHRDVKPANILVASREGRENAYLCDFGLARHVSSVRSLTGERAFVGTIDYVPPEQIEGGKIDGRADVYSLGCVLYECLAGARPFDRESELSVIFAHLNAPPPLLSDLRPELPDAFDAVFAKALAKSPEDRYATCREVVEAGGAALDGQGVERPKPRWRLPVVVMAVAVAVAAAVAAGVLGARGGHRPAHAATRPRTLLLRPNGLGLIDATTHRVFAKTGFGDVVWDVAFAGSSAWALLGDGSRIAQIAVATHRLENILRVPGGHGERIAAGGGAVWVTQHGGPGVVAIDTATGKVSRFTVGGGPGDGIAYGAGSLWLARGVHIVRVDPRTGRVLHRFSAGGAATLVHFADGAVWAASSENGALTKIDPVRNRITARNTKLHGWITDLTVGGRFVWAAVVPDGTVFKLSEDDLTLQSSPGSGPDPERISFGGGNLWIANSVARTISRLDPDSGRRIRLVADVLPGLATYHDGLLWSSGGPIPKPLPPISGQELRISMPNDFLGADPSTSSGPLRAQLSYATCANLLDYPDSAGEAGAHLRPELAATMPTLSRDRRTYTFRIRPGVRFSPRSPDRPATLRRLYAVPETVTAQTFRHTIERALSPKLGGDAPAAPFASDIVGAPAYRSGKAAHISGIIARGDSLSIRLIRPAGDFLTRISMPYFCPVPTREPAVPDGNTGAIPSLGPYYMSSLEGNRTGLLRNPNYTGQRPRNVERIVYTTGIPTPTAAAQVAAGLVDYLPTDFDSSSMLAAGGTLDQRYGQGSAAARHGAKRYFLQSQPVVHEIVFNTRRPLFRDLRLRRAANYALDRPALAAVWREPAADAYIPPAVPGYRREHVYPVHGPDLRKARRLAGRQSRHAVLYFCDDAWSRIADIVRTDLSRIGIGVTIVEGRQPCHDNPAAAHADLMLWGFYSPEPDPAPFLRQALAERPYGVALGPGPWIDRSFRRRLERANQLSGNARVEALTRLERELMRTAPIAVFGNRVQPDYFSTRVGCKVFQDAYRFVDLAALCVHKSG
jgi:ABC-type transport system substrate-binding protein/tRNA A-37 threonylcarbamoyl transferase component Bud32/streptogramin lyase